MATAAVQQPISTPTYSPGQTLATSSKPAQQKPQHVKTTLRYHKPNEDGSPPHPTYTDRPETYERPYETHPVTVRDVTGHESEYTLDGNGFHFYKHTSVEKDFVDDEQIKDQYYKETEQLLKDAYVPNPSSFTIPTKRSK
jgi:hypothetical protein